MRLKEKQETDVSEAKGSKYFKKDGAIHLLEVMVLSRSVKSDSFATPWTVALQASLSMGFSRQECWSGLPCPSPGDHLPNSGIKLRSCALRVGSLQSEPPGKP